MSAGEIKVLTFSTDDLVDGKIHISADTLMTGKVFNILFDSSVNGEKVFQIKVDNTQTIMMDSLVWAKTPKHTYPFWARKH